MTRKRSTKSAEITTPPRRIDTHRIDTQAVRVIRTKLTPDWIERSVEDRDYGIDMMLEAFDAEDPTGILVLLQIKGHEASFGDEDVSLSVPVKTLLYAQMFQTPFFLISASITDGQAYFVWLQKYINTRLNLDNPRWNRQATAKVYFPRDNLLNDAGLKKIRSLVTYVVHRDMGISFLGHLIWLRQHIEDFHSGHGKEALDAALSRLDEIIKLEAFWTAYDDHCALDLDEMRLALEKAKAYGTFDYGDSELVDRQLSELHAVELMFLSKDEGDAFISSNMDTDLPY